MSITSKVRSRTRAQGAAGQINRFALNPYLEANLTLIPLRRWNETDDSGKAIGKAPRDKNWTDRAYNSADVIKRCIEHRWNVGFRIPDTWHVIDVDPRNDGIDGFQKFCDHYLLDTELWPLVVTGSGGSHFYLRTPAGAHLVNSLPNEFPGVEFKGLGRQVVAAGSWHPNGKQYEWEDFEGRFDLGDAPQMPEHLLESLRRTQHAPTEIDEGQFTDEQLAAALDELDPAGFRDQDRWVQLMFSCHHATGGTGREVFAEWSRRDFGYEGSNDDIEVRWDSCKSSHPNPVSVGFLNKCLRDTGKGKFQLGKTSAREDFDDGMPWLPIENEKWPRRIRYRAEANSRSNAAIFLQHRPEQLISSDRTIYSLNMVTKLWAPRTDDELAVEIAATDPGTLLGHQKVNAIADAIHMDRHTYARPFSWITAPDDAPSPEDTIIFKNGILNFGSGRLMPHSGDFFATGVPDYDYIPSAACDLWLEKLSEWLDDSYHATLQEFMGYALTPDTRYEFFLLLLGVPRGGKGTIMSVMQNLIGSKHHTSRTLNDLGNDFGLDNTFDKRIIFIPDAHDVGPGKHTTALERIKSITGRDELSINRKHRDMVTARIPAKLVIAANRLPKFIDESGALAARQLILRFENSWRGREDKDLRSKLCAELPGIANWALEGLRRLRSNGAKFTIGAKGRAAAIEAAEAQSPALRFANYALMVTGDPSDFLSLKAVHGKYIGWAGEVERLKNNEIRGRNDFKEDLLAALMAQGVRYHRAQKWFDPKKRRQTTRRGLTGIRFKR